MAMVHKMVEQKIFSKKYLKNKISDLVFEKNGKRLDSKNWWDEIYRYSFYDLFADLHHKIFTDFELYPHIDGTINDYLFVKFLLQTWFIDEVEQYATFDSVDEKHLMHLCSWLATII